MDEKDTIQIIASKFMSFPTGQEVASSSSLDFPQPCHHFTISEILEATKHFDESLVVGRGGFGKVYKGTVVVGANALDVAIKRLYSTSNQGALEFWAEVKMLSKLRHCHLVSLIGYCNDEQEMILVYEYMPHGTLEDHLHKYRTSLSWLRRLKICIGAARGLEYLHTGTGIEHGVIHRDVKSSNILLHNSWVAKVSDFGLSKICPKNQSSTGVSTFVKGTFGYLDPYYFSTGKLTFKSDVYAFGVILLEVLCRKRAVDASLEWGLAKWAQDSIKEGKLKQIVDSTLEGRIVLKCRNEFARLADQCLHSHPDQRPTMAEVVVSLESVLALQEKGKTTLPRAGMTIFGRNVPIPNYREHSGSVVKNLKSLDMDLYNIGGEDRIFRRFDFATLNVATENFSEANVVLQHYMGYYGEMYKGRMQNGEEIAILIMSPAYFELEMMMNEVSILVKIENENLFSVLGYCIYGTKVFLVYGSAPYATLQQLLFDTTHIPLDWNKRYKILLGVARVLLYLHKHAPIRVIHGDLKSDKIILDESLDPKLSDFRIASCLAINETDCIVPHIQRTFVKCTRGMAPEVVHHGRHSCKTDVFNFGVVVLETISGIEEVTFNLRTNEIKFLHKCGLKSWLEGSSFRIDPRINVDSSLMTRFIEIGLLCIQEDPKDRPAMDKVVDMLLGGKSSTLNHINASINDYDVGAVEEFISDPQTTSCMS